jgi:steroid 5-alpha reductase family enzyme
LVERFIEQNKGASKVVGAWWGIAAAIVASVVAFLIQNHLG